MSPAKEKTDKKGFSAEERAAMKERAKELKAEERANKDRAAGEKDLLSKIDEMSESQRVIAKRIHEIITENAPVLSPKTWYGMPAYAIDGKIVCFFQSSDKFESRYSTLGFNDAAMIDEGNMWPTAYAVTALSPAIEEKIAELIRKAVS